MERGCVRAIVEREKQSDREKGETEKTREREREKAKATKRERGSERACKAWFVPMLKIPVTLNSGSSHQ